MQRAGVFIGVNKTGQLQTLNDASGSARRMHAWAVGQGMKDGSGAILIADDEPGAGAVTPDRICEAVQKAIATGPEQLIVYFAGHGVVIRQQEQWLLTNAPGNSNHAVNMGQCSAGAEYGQVPHVVIISDACRTAPEGIQAGNVAGGSIFENVPSADARFVDRYYACGLGRPAGELKSQDESVAAYRAVYTEVLLEALGGKFRDSLAERDGAWYAEARPLRDLLAREVPERIRSRQLKVRFQQVCTEGLRVARSSRNASNHAGRAGRHRHSSTDREIPDSTARTNPCPTKTTATVTASCAIARARRDSSHASNAGPSTATEPTSSGARSPVTTSPPSTAATATRASTIPPRHPMSSAGSSAKVLTTRATESNIKAIRYGNTVSRPHPEPPVDWRTKWLLEVVFDYGEGHYEDQPLDPGTPVDSDSQPAPRPVPRIATFLADARFRPRR